MRRGSVRIGIHRRLTIRSSRPHVVALAACFALRLHASAAPPRVGLTQALGAMDTRQGWWLISGFLVAPLVAALTSAVISISINTNGGNFKEFLVAIFIVYVFSAPAILAIGIPSLALAHRLNLVRWWVAVIAGLLSGGFIRLIGHFDQLDIAWLQTYWIEMLHFSLIGATPALFVWWCWHSAYARRQSGLGT